MAARLRRQKMTPRFTITNAVAADLTRIERARGFLEATTLSERRVRQMSDPNRRYVLAKPSHGNL